MLSFHSQEQNGHWTVAARSEHIMRSPVELMKLWRWKLETGAAGGKDS